MITKKFNVLIQITKDTEETLDFLKYYKDILENENNIFINIVFWYDKNSIKLNESLKSKILEFKDCKIYDSYPILKNILFNIMYCEENKINEFFYKLNSNFKFNLFFYDKNSLISAYIQLFSFIKAKLNYYENTKQNKNTKHI